jgi:hypothetical protein
MLFKVVWIDWRTIMGSMELSAIHWLCTYVPCACSYVHRCTYIHMSTASVSGLNLRESHGFWTSKTFD